MYYKLYEIRIKDYWNSIETMTFYKIAENFTELAEKTKDLEEAFNIEIKSIREIEDFDHSNKKNLYKVRIAPSEYYDFDTFTTAEDYVEAAKSYGTSNARIIFRYVLPNAMGPIIVNTTMSISDMMLSAAGLSFIGMGIQPPSPEWGALLSNAQTYLFSAPYMLLFPGMFILASSLAFNLVGDGLTDALDPKLRD